MFNSNTCLLLLSLCAFSGAAEQEFWHPLRPVPDPLGCGESNVPCPLCDATPRICKPRVRRSWGTLSNAEKQQFIDAINILKNTPTSKGQGIYGSDFTSYNDMILQHAMAANDPRGDQGHLDQHFIVFHRMLLLKFENSLLSVDPSISGTPYWDLREGPDEVFGSTPLSFGSVPGAGPNHEVTDGAFSDWTVSPYEPEVRQEHDLDEGFGNIFNNATGTTLLRTTNVLTNSLVRYPSCAGAGPLRGNMGVLAYSADDYETCVSQTNFASFNWCLESTDTNWAHGSPHFWVGSADSQEYGFGCRWFSPPNVTASGVPQGDYLDKYTSPNDPIFWLHHGFLDKMAMEFMRRSPDQAAQLWQFKASHENGTDPVVEGTFLEDVISSAWPFEGRVLQSKDVPPLDPLKYSDVLCHVGPPTAVYTYDSFDDTICDAQIEDGISVDDVASGASSATLSLFASLAVIAAKMAHFFM